MGVALPPNACRFQDPSVTELCGHFIRLKVIRKLLFIRTNASTKRTILQLINDIERDNFMVLNKDF